MATVGDLSEIPGELKIEWKIKNFSALSQEVDDKYCSPKFYFVGSSWNIYIFTNGQSSKNSVGWISLYANRTSTGPPVTLVVSFSIKTKNEKSHCDRNFTYTFDKKAWLWGYQKYLSRSDIIAQKSDLIPSDVLTVVVTFKVDKAIKIAGSLFSRLNELSEDMREIFKQAKNTDVVLQTNGQSTHAHRMILEKRSSVFAAMFRHDFKETQTGEISIDDTEISTMEVILEYLYTGDIDSLTTENVLSIYAAAEKYDVKVVKELCSEYIRRNLTEDWVCDVVKFAELYDDKDIFLCVREYIKENARKILKTEKWKIFAKDNGELIFELFGSVLLSFLPE